jgi:hypothetical protein
MSRWPWHRAASGFVVALLPASTAMVVLAGGCQPQALPEQSLAAPKQHAASQHPQEGPGVQSPLLVRWLPVQRVAADVLVLTLEVRRPTVALPLQVSLRLPAGAVILTAPDLTPVQRPATGASLLSWQLQGRATLLDQVVAVVDGQLAGLGAHAEVPLRAAMPVPNGPQAKRLVLPGGKPVSVQPLTTAGPQRP